MEKVTSTQTYYSVDDRSNAAIKTYFKDGSKEPSWVGSMEISVDPQPTFEACREALKAKLQKMLKALDA